MMSISNFFRLSGLALVAGGLLVGCGSGVPEVTDEDIIAFLGETMGRGESAPPATINKGAVECAEILSGLNADVLKDMPEEWLGLEKTSCRESFNRFVTDRARNTKGFKLEHFENKDFARRIAVAAEKSRAIYAEFNAKRTAERERQEALERAQRLEQAEKELEQARADFEQSLDGYEALADEFLALCTQVQSAIDALYAQNPNDNASLPYGVGDCKQSRQEILAAAEKNRAQWAAVEVYDGFTQAGFTKPYIEEHGFGTTTGLRHMIASLESALAGFNRRLGRGG